jgi:hypothetical protein
MGELCYPTSIREGICLVLRFVTTKVLQYGKVNMTYMRLALISEQNIEREN